MQRAVMRVSSLCILAAIYAQVMKGSRFAGVIRMVLGLEIFATLFGVLRELMQNVVRWS